MTLFDQEIWPLQDWLSEYFVIIGIKCKFFHETCSFFLADMYISLHAYMLASIQTRDVLKEKNTNVTITFFANFRLDKRLPGRAFKIVVKKVLVDQLIASPVVISLFFMTLGVMRKESLHETMTEIREKFLRLYKAEWLVWPTAQVINFWILPLKYRVLYDNTISLGYDVYTSMVINEPIQHKETINDNKDKHLM